MARQHKRRGPRRGINRDQARWKGGASAAARLISWSLSRWYGLPPLAMAQLIELAKRLKEEAWWMAHTDADVELTRPERQKWWSRYMRVRLELASLAKDDGAAAKYFRALMDHADRQLLELAERLPALHLLEPRSPEEAALHRLDVRTILLGERLPKLFFDVYPSAMFEDSYPKLGRAELSERCHAIYVKRWGPGVLFIAIAARFLGVEPPFDGNDCYKARDRLKAAAVPVSWPPATK